MSSRKTSVPKGPLPVPKKAVAKKVWIGLDPDVDDYRIASSSGDTYFPTKQAVLDRHTEMVENGDYDSDANVLVAQVEGVYSLTTIHTHNPKTNYKFEGTD